MDMEKKTMVMEKKMILEKRRIKLIIRNLKREKPKVEQKQNHQVR